MKRQPTLIPLNPHDPATQVRMASIALAEWKSRAMGWFTGHLVLMAFLFTGGRALLERQVGPPMLGLAMVLLGLLAGLMALIGFTCVFFARKVPGPRVRWLLTPF